MIKNYLKIVLRNLIKHKFYTFLNTAGLAIGIACSFLIFMYIHHELSYDRYHEKADQIYRVVRERNINGEAVPSVGQPFRLGETLANNIPQIKAQVRFFRLHQEAPVVSRGEDQFYEERFYFTDSNVFEVFSFNLLRGAPSTVLKEPFSVVLTESMVQKYFGEQDPIGKTLTLQNQYELTVTGIVEDTPKNSHFHFDFLASHENLDDIFFAGPRFKTTWIYNPCYTYILLAENSAISDILPQMESFVNRHINDDLKRLYLNIYFQKLTDIHLHSHYQSEIETNSDIIYIYIFSAIGLLILLIACINFINLSTARSIRRAKEVGLRKVLGARRDQLIKQFLGESILLSFLALLFAVAIIELFLPTYNTLTGKHFEADFLVDPWILLTLFGITLFTGLISGLFPAFYLSAFKPVKVLKVGFSTGPSGRASFLRKLLVVTQFTISIAMIIGTIIVYEQLDYLKNKKLGFDREQILTVPINNTAIQDHISTFKSELLRQANILNVAAASHVIGKNIDNHGYRPEGVSEKDYTMMPGLYADQDLVKTLGAEIVAGRDFSREIATDTAEAFIINETAVKKFGWSSPAAAIGKQFEFVDVNSGRIIGVIRDFHFLSLYDKIEPLVIHYNSRGLNHLLIRFNQGDASNVVSSVENLWQSYAPKRPFEYIFLDQELASIYESEEKLSQIFNLFAALAAFIACLGLLGLASFSATQRIKEIGIRKVLGASIPNIFLVLSSEFIKLIVIANLFAWPIAYFAMKNWLQDFSYRVEIGWWMFALAGGSAVFIALLTVSWQAIRAALVNPVEALRYE